MSGEAMAVEEVPEFEQIIETFGVLLNRLKDTKRTAVRVSDLLIGVRDTGNGFDDSEKSVPSPDYFTIKCLDLLAGLHREIEQLEMVNDRLLRHIQRDSIK